VGAGAVFVGEGVEDGEAGTGADVVAGPQAVMSRLNTIRTTSATVCTLQLIVANIGISNPFMKKCTRCQTFQICVALAQNEPAGALRRPIPIPNQTSPPPARSRSLRRILNQESIFPAAGL
jgi:hypothetical protein